MAAVYAAQGYDAAALKAKGFDASSLRWAAGFSVDALKAAGFDAKALKDADVDCRSLAAAGFAVAELKAAGFSANALRDAGFDAIALRSEGFTSRVLRSAGFDAASLREAGVGPDEIRIVFDIPADVKSAVGRRFSPNTLKAAGFTPEELHEAVGFHDWTVDVIRDPNGAIAFEGRCGVCGEVWSRAKGFGGALSHIYSLQPFHQTGGMQLSRKAQSALAAHDRRRRHDVDEESEAWGAEDW